MMNLRQNAGYPIAGSSSEDQELMNVCPSLILDKYIVCDAVEEVFQPSRRMIRESCTNEQHLSCPLRQMV